MAKIFSTEKLSLNGDSIRIRSENAGEFEITDSNNNVLISRSSIEANVQSLNTQDSTNKSTLESTIASLSTVESDNDSTLVAHVGSLNTQDSTNKSTLESTIASLSTVESDNDSTLVANVQSLHTQDSTNKSTLDSSIAALETTISTNDVFSSNETVTLNSTEITVTFPANKFSAAPAVVGVLRSTGANDPIIGARLEGSPSTTSAKFVFSDSIPSSNYTFDVLASV
jgi:hypothetical protein